MILCLLAGKRKNDDSLLDAWNQLAAAEFSKHKD
jgi:hypothetical protein